jgi:hypothetical protein
MIAMAYNEESECQSKSIIQIIGRKLRQQRNNYRLMTMREKTKQGRGSIQIKKD